MGTSTLLHQCRTVATVYQPPTSNGDPPDNVCILVWAQGEKIIHTAAAAAAAATATKH